MKILYRLETILPLIRFKVNYVNMLENICIENKQLLPTFKLLSKTNNDYKLECHYSTQCNAMNFVSIGNSIIILFKFK